MESNWIRDIPKKEGAEEGRKKEEDEEGKSRKRFEAGAGGSSTLKEKAGRRGMCEYVVAGFIMSEVGGVNFPYKKVGEIYVGLYLGPGSFFFRPFCQIL